ncbi:hypothetical protein ADEAN_000671100 [Angomonas deanei]|uniref:Uncharacterized protein n=1 Tax=Angomonas deanei TaxID=59799 RepID=A0A7G2CIG3_9TRYP|nr:hypothetical protein ADEAN_000671100 [Angomonas deanei]
MVTLIQLLIVKRIIVQTEMIKLFLLQQEIDNINNNNEETANSNNNNNNSAETNNKSTIEEFMQNTNNNNANGKNNMKSVLDKMTSFFIHVPSGTVLLQLFSLCLPQQSNNNNNNNNKDPVFLSTLLGECFYEKYQTFLEENHNHNNNVMNVEENENEGEMQNNNHNTNIFSELNFVEADFIDGFKLWFTHQNEDPSDSMHKDKKEDNIIYDYDVYLYCLENKSTYITTSHRHTGQGRQGLRWSEVRDYTRSLLGHPIPGVSHPQQLYYYYHYLCHTGGNSSTQPSLYSLYYYTCRIQPAIQHQLQYNNNNGNTTHHNKKCDARTKYALKLSVRSILRRRRTMTYEELLSVLNSAGIIIL